MLFAEDWLPIGGVANSAQPGSRAKAREVLAKAKAEVAEEIAPVAEENKLP